MTLFHLSSFNIHNWTQFFLSKLRYEKHDGDDFVLCPLCFQKWPSPLVAHYWHKQSRLWHWPMEMVMVCSGCRLQYRIVHCKYCQSCQNASRTCEKGCNSDIVIKHLDAAPVFFVGRAHTFHLSYLYASARWGLEKVRQKVHKCRLEKWQTKAMVGPLKRRVFRFLLQIMRESIIFPKTE